MRHVLRALMVLGFLAGCAGVAPDDGGHDLGARGRRPDAATRPDALPAPDAPLVADASPAPDAPLVADASPAPDAAWPPPPPDAASPDAPGPDASSPAACTDPDSQTCLACVVGASPSCVASSRCQSEYVAIGLCSLSHCGCWFGVGCPSVVACVLEHCPTQVDAVVECNRSCPGTEDCF
jgi:hypothetical protein